MCLSIALINSIHILPTSASIGLLSRVCNKTLHVPAFFPFPGKTLIGTFGYVANFFGNNP